MTPLLIRGRQGLGDCIYSRSVIREVVEQFDVYLETPWPQIFGGLPIKCVRRPTVLRTQEKNAKRGDLTWYVPPTGIEPKVVHYAGSKGTMLEGLCATLGVRPPVLTFDLPTFAPWPGKRPYVVVRPATVRREWPASSRNPRPDYLALAADRLREHFDVVSVADLVPNVEWPVLPLPYADETFHAGELAVEQLMALVQGAAGMVAGVGWAVPAAVAYRTPLFLIYGGSGQHDGRHRIFDSRMPSENVHHAIPDRFCLCANRSHSCDKRISTIERQVDQWAMGLAARGSPAMAA